MEGAVLNYKSSLRLQSGPRQSELSVPCKLNNVKTNYNTLDNYNGLFENRV